MTIASLCSRALRWGFHQLYHGLAWSYDTVASVVSLGEWYNWVRCVQPMLVGPRILEIGTGTGHLLASLAREGAFRPHGLDESPEMLRLTRERIGASIPLVRAVVQRLPMSMGSYDCVVMTFPPEYISHAGSLAEIYRVLRSDGRLVALPAALITGQGPVHRVMRFALAALGETPRNVRELIVQVILPRLEAVGFQASLTEVRSAHSTAFVIIASKLVANHDAGRAAVGERSVL